MPLGGLLWVLILIFIYFYASVPTAPFSHKVLEELSQTRLNSLTHPLPSTIQKVLPAFSLLSLSLLSQRSFSFDVHLPIGYFDGYIVVVTYRSEGGAFHHFRNAKRPVLLRSCCICDYSRPLLSHCCSDFVPKF